MESVEGNNMAVKVAFIHDANKLSREEERHENVDENNNDRFAITQCIGETDTHLGALITRYAQTLTNYSLRYPTNQNFNYEALAPLLQFHLNNAGDPFLGSNLHGILVGREQLPDGILYTSEDSHYSIFKIARMYRMQCVKVASLISGEIDCAQLQTSLLANKDKPAIINLNIDDNFTRRWNLASNKNIAHVVVLKHVTIEMLDTFVCEFVQKRSVWYKDGQVQPLCISKDVGSRNCACSIHKLSINY
ncbi:unnamed protein product [Vicia faba]|uniref:Uncharacterized protein n=1 Tax=Vicia faba TaxID=3906 RepID=A0AAV0YIY0_VICFA|nr:unnamed protein product [Vicia faba]